jgi:imidazole glycerol-phosphate synthase subunit HisH
MLVKPIERPAGHVVIIDYGMSNLFSVSNSLRALGCEAAVTNKPEDVLAADRVILPGVGAFGIGMKNLHALGLVEPLREVAKQGRPLLGICLGMQLLADESFEHGHHQGLSIIPGSVRRMQGEGDVRIPHIGWNTVAFSRNSRLYRDMGDRADFYFVHSYHFDVASPEDVNGWCEYGSRFAASVERGSIAGAQCHPEKSHKAGLTILRNFLTGAPC